MRALRHAARVDVENARTPNELCVKAARPGRYRKVIQAIPALLARRYFACIVYVWNTT
jgi:hypothetical protein